MSLRAPLFYQTHLTHHRMHQTSLPSGPYEGKSRDDAIADGMGVRSPRSCAASVLPQCVNKPVRCVTVDEV